LAANLAYFMGQRGLSQKALAEKCGVAQTTISLYLNPTRRKAGITGKAASAKLSEVEMLARSLDVEIWELLRDLNDDECKAQAQIELAYRALQPPLPMHHTKRPVHPTFSPIPAVAPKRKQA
jgi:transcriptional regulator with XRE-family HTH domain